MKYVWRKIALTEGGVSLDWFRFGRWQQVPAAFLEEPRMAGSPRAEDVRTVRRDLSIYVPELVPSPSLSISFQ